MNYRIAATLLVLLLPSTANATIELDQYNLPGPGIVENVMQARSIDYQGQSFTVGLTGTLANILVDVGDYNVPPVDVDFHLASVVGGIAQFSHSYEVVVPSSSISPNGAGQGPALADWLNLDFSSFDIAVTPGEQFALVFHSPISFEDTGSPNYNQVNWFLSNPGTYVGGVVTDPGAHLQDSPLGVGNGDDAFFETFVNVASVPEPATWALFIVGFGAIGMMLRKMRRRSSETMTPLPQ